MEQRRKKLVAWAEPPPELPYAEPDGAAMKPQITQLMNAPTPALKCPETMVVLRQPKVRVTSTTSDAC
ncbi:hypothetical protein TSUD_290050 [Trifolium subterraneum]|uniref:Uncharacterized protein n=1 Tax=Trifolium subterraneum TaxID=3900 RepID=A0A2Z6P6R6_TRISU|nr:hypothetical protein TSUD_290050 [Trifolium subterraneum]